MDTNKGVKLAVGILVVALLAAFLAPIAINAFNNPTQTTLIQDNGTTYEVTANLNSTGDIAGSHTSVSITLNDTAQNTQITKSVSNQSSKTFAMPDGNVNVTVESINSTGADATISYEYPDDYGWSDGSQALYGLIPLFLILAIVMFAVYTAMDHN